MSLPFGTQQAFFSRVELVAPVDDWRASRCVARCPARYFFLLWTLWRAASSALEHWWSRIVAQTALWHRLHTVCVSSLREYKSSQLSAVVRVMQGPLEIRSGSAAQAPAVLVLSCSQVLASILQR